MLQQRGGLLAAASLAAETALRLSPRHTGRWEAHSLLGRCAAARNDARAAEAAFEQAALEAQTAGLPGLQLIALGELQNLVLAPQGREAEGQRRLEALAEEKLGRGLDQLWDFLHPDCGD